MKSELFLGSKAINPRKNNQFGRVFSLITEARGPKPDFHTL